MLHAVSPVVRLILMGSLLLLCINSNAHPPESVLPGGSFESVSGDGLPTGWILSEGARTTGRRASVVAVRADVAIEGQHSLYLRGDRRTGRWQALLSPPVPVQPGEALRLSGFMRAHDLKRERHQFQSCGIGLIFRDALGAALLLAGSPEEHEGTHEWRPLSTVATAPEGAVDVQAMVFCAMSGEAWLDNLSLVHLPPLPWRVTETERMIFYDQEAAPVTAAHRATTLANLDAIEDTLGLRLPHRVHLYRYQDRAQKTLHTGIDGNAHATPPDQIHTIWSTDHHELVHLVAHVGGPAHSPLLGEGLAEGLDSDWNGQPFTYWIDQLVAEGRLPALESIDTAAEFRAHSSLVTYPIAGSFVHFLINRSGLEAFQQVYYQDSQRTLDDILTATYDVGLHELEQEWHAALGIHPEQ